MNETTTSIARNTRAMMLSQVVTWGSSFVLMLFLPRYLGAEDFGRLYFAITANTIAFLIMDLGFTNLIVKEIARNRDKTNVLFSNAALLRVIIWFISFIVTVLFVVLSGYSTQTLHVVAVLSFANVFCGLYDLIHRVFVGYERMEYRSIGLVIEKIFLAAVGVVMLLLGYGSLVIALVMLASMVLNLLASMYFLRKTISLKIEVQFSQWRPLLRGGFPFLVTSVLSFVYYRIDVIMLSEMTGNTVVGWYGAPYRLFDTLMFFPSILNTAVYPVLSRLFHTARQTLIDTSRQILHLTLIVAVPIAVGMAALSTPIISLLFGLEEYGHSVIILQILSISLILVYVDFVLNTVIISQDRQNRMVVTAIVATVINITFNYFAIDYFQTHHGNGGIGAAVTTAITELCVGAMCIYIMPKGSFGLDSVVTAGKTLLSGAVMWGAIWFLEHHQIGWILSGSVGAVVYVIMLFALKVVSKREVGFLLTLVPFTKRLGVREGSGEVAISDKLAE